MKKEVKRIDTDINETNLDSSLFFILFIFSLISLSPLSNFLELQQTLASVLHSDYSGLLLLALFLQSVSICTDLNSLNFSLATFFSFPVVPLQQSTVLIAASNAILV